MRNPEQAVDKVLHGLREVKAPPGMEHRILLAMEKRAPMLPQTVWRRMLKFAPVRVVVTGGAACAGLVGAGLWIATLHRSAPRRDVAHSIAAQPTHGQAPESPSLPPRNAQPSFRRAKLVQGSVIGESDTLALEETRAPSQPAPPLPLTEQERLLQRVARRHDPNQMAMLNPEMRSKQELQAKVEFQEFFEPARPAEERRSTSSTYNKGDTQ